MVHSACILLCKGRWEDCQPTVTPPGGPSLSKFIALCFSQAPSLTQDLGVPPHLHVVALHLKGLPSSFKVSSLPEHSPLTPPSPWPSSGLWVQFPLYHRDGPLTPSRLLGPARSPRLTAQRSVHLAPSRGCAGSAERMESAQFWNTKVENPPKRLEKGPS